MQTSKLQYLVVDLDVFFCHESLNNTDLRAWVTAMIKQVREIFAKSLITNEVITTGMKFEKVIMWHTL